MLHWDNDFPGLKSSRHLNYRERKTTGATQFYDSCCELSLDSELEWSGMPKFYLSYLEKMKTREQYIFSSILLTHSWFSLPCLDDIGFSA